MKLAFRQHKKTNNIHYWNKYQTLRNKEIIELRKSKQLYSHNLDKLLSSSDCNSKMFWKISKQILNLGQTSTSIPTLHHNSIYAESDFDKAKMLNTYFSSHSVVDYTNKQLPPIPHINHSIESITITTQDVSDVFQHLDIIKACGPDSIKPSSAERRLLYSCSPIFNYFNCSLEQGYFPSSWKDANVTPIYEKEDKPLPSNYIPTAAFQTFYR